MAFERYLSEVPWWATSLQAIEGVREGEREQSFEVQLAQPPQFVIANLTVAGGKLPPWPMGRLSLHAGGGTWYRYQDDDSQYVNERSTLIVLNRIQHTHWRIDLEATGELPLELNFMAFHPVGLGGSGSPPVPPLLPAAAAPPPPPSGYCRPCKITAKALALAIVAAATLPALPAALITAVASYLGVTAVVAAAFIGSVLGDTADIIAEKLCVRVGLCP
jgi:hypothetical protein